MQLHTSIAEFLLQARADGRSPHTVEQYQRHLAWLQHALGAQRSVATLKPNDFARALAAMARAPVAGRSSPRRATTLNALRSTVRTFGRFLADAGYCAQDPARLIRRARGASSPPRSLSEDQCARFRATLAQASAPAEQRDAVLFELLLSTGVRLTSALRADVADVDFERETLLLRHTKGSRPQRVVLTHAMTERLRAFAGRREHGPLFVASGGHAMSARQAQRSLRRWLDRAGIETAASPHALRHTFAMHLYEASRDLELVRAALGHRSISSTAIYASIAEPSLRACLEKRAALVADDHMIRE
ncbi:MAG: tyrosine-type recombinase/integrase [Planctomycetes bacterium]|nr:tyrosine-type recombinase/integrase [Planctomycetota bacterium]